MPHRTGRHPLGKARFFHSFLTTKSDGQILFRILRNLGIAIECQKIFQNGDSWVIVDFFVPSVQLVIELDGKHHLLNKKYDAERSHWLAHVYKVKICRFFNAQVNKGQAERRIEEMLRTIDRP